MSASCWVRAGRRWLAACAVGMGLVACGGGGGGAEPAAPPSPAAPQITTPPQSQSVADGAAANFSVGATGADLTYQWQRNGGDLAGATAATLALPTASLADDGARLRVVVRNAGGSVTSAEAVLTVTPVSPRISAGPVDATVVAGQRASFEVTAAGSAPLAYQWLRDGVEIAGATAARHETPATAPADSGAAFAVRVSNAVGSITSAAARLTVTPQPEPPTIAQQPQGASVAAGQTARFEVVAGGTAPLTYQWRRNGSAIANAIGASHTTPPVTAGDNGARYSVVVSNLAGTVTSADAVLTVVPGVQASGQARLALGTGHVVALRANGNIVAWGLNNTGQLGTGPAIPGTNAREVMGTGVALAAGAFESLALGADGIVRGWGRKFPGGTIIGGDAVGSGTDLGAPAPGGWPAGMTHLAVGSANSYAVGRRNDGTVWQLPGTAATISGGLNHTARQLQGLPAIAAVGGGVSGDPTAIGTDGTVWRITFVPLGGGGWGTSVAQVPGFAGAVAAHCNGIGCVGLDAAGTVRVKSDFDGNPAAVVTGLPRCVQIAVTGTDFLALGDDGSLWRWRTGSAPRGVNGVGAIAELAAGLQTALLRLTDGTVWDVSGATPVQVPGINLN